MPISHEGGAFLGGRPRLTPSLPRLTPSLPEHVPSLPEHVPSFPRTPLNGSREKLNGSREKQSNCRVAAITSGVLRFAQNSMPGYTAFPPSTAAGLKPLRGLSMEFCCAKLRAYIHGIVSPP
jgi:hypothetical protein